MKLTIEIHGDSQWDLELGLAEVARSLAAGNSSGFDKNNSGRYAFNVEDPTEEDETNAAVIDHFAKQMFEETPHEN